MRNRHVSRRRLPIVWLAGAVTSLVVAGCTGAAPANVSPAATTTGSSNAHAFHESIHSTTASPATQLSEVAPFNGLTFMESALGRTFTTSHFDADAGDPFQIRFENHDPFKHAIYIVVGPTRPTAYSETDLAGMSAFRGDYVPGPAATTYHVAALPPGMYSFFCPVHQAMVGTISVLSHDAFEAAARRSGR